MTGEPTVLERLGTEAHAGVDLWRFAVEMQISRIEQDLREHQEALRVGRLDVDEHAPWGQSWNRLMHDCHFLLVAVRAVVRYTEAYNRAAPDWRYIEALDAFFEAAPHAKAFRDQLEHLDEYLQGTGWAQKRGEVPPKISAGVLVRLQQGRVYVRFGDQRLDVYATAAAAIRLADTADEIWGDRVFAAMPPPTPKTEAQAALARRAEREAARQPPAKGLIAAPTEPPDPDEPPF